ncbi:MAG: heavy metal translocating P-type ATPase, partial [Victivallaceae bacterium]
ASLGAFAIGEMAEGVAVMIFYGVGEMLQDAAVAKSRGNIEKLMDLRADRANVRRKGQIVAVAPETVEVGEVIVVRPGEKVALDGVLESGTGFLDTRALTGESAPRRVLAGDEVLSGSISLDGVLELQVSRPFGESTVSRILELVRHAAEKKSPTEKFITRFARVYTPAVVLLALLAAIIPPLAGFGTWQSWIYRALTFLIVSCPCALVLSIPLSFFGGIGGAARRGILVKGGNDLELLARIGTVAFDKTGTLTRGVFKVVAINPAPGVTAHDLLELAALAESQSNHPIASSVLAAYGQRVGEAPPVREIAGLGIEAASSKGVIAAGNAALMRKFGIEVADDAGSAVHVACAGRYCGRLLIADELKPGVREAVEALRQTGVGRIAMLTGDNPAAAALAAEAAGIKLVRAGLLPQDKIIELERLMATEAPGCKTAFVGDGINDAPVLARADLGIAMGGIGSDAAIEAADVVLMTDDPGKIPEAITVARKTGRIVRENIALALGLKGAVLVLAFFGFASAWFAIFADVGVALLAVANALRALR